MVADNSGSSSSSTSGSSDERPGKTEAPGASELRVAANRANAKKSTGPKTEAGKASSRMNALRHGLCATMAILPGDDEKEYDAFAEGIVASLKPRDHAESVLTDQYVSVSWKLRRLGDAEMELSDMRRGEMTVGRMLALELKEGEGPMLRLMNLEDRLRRTLSHTVRQIKDLHLLRKIMAEGAEEMCELPSPIPPRQMEATEKTGNDPENEATATFGADDRDENARNEANSADADGAQMSFAPSACDQPDILRNEPNRKPANISPDGVNAPPTGAEKVDRRPL